MAWVLFHQVRFYDEEVQKFCEEKVYQPTMDAMKEEGRDFAESCL